MLVIDDIKIWHLYISPDCFSYYIVSLVIKHLLYIIIMIMLLLYILLLLSFYYLLGRFMTILRAQVRDLKYHCIRYFLRLCWDCHPFQFIGIFFNLFLLSYLSLFSYLLWTLTLFAGILVLISDGLIPVLRLSVYTWEHFRSTYIRHCSVSVSVGSGCYRVVSEPRFIPDVGNHLGQCSGSYQ